MQPLVLAIEPDLRQAAIVKRIIREKVLADVAVVDSRDAALEAMRTTVPDVLLLSALLSPRDEDELVAHLRTLQHAEHLQTHTIPQLASAIGPGDAKPSKGLLAAFRRRKGADSVPAGCDPDLFAEEVKTYLQRASDKKRERLDSGAAGFPAPAAIPAAAATHAERPAAGAPETGSSWASPFEWRPAGAVRTHAAPAEPPTADPVAASAVPVTEPAPAPLSPPVVAPAPRYPLTQRNPRGWWFEERPDHAGAADPASELRAVLAALAVPDMIAGVAYADGVRIRRVRLAAA